jgi:hypothetical protein
VPIPGEITSRPEPQGWTPARRFSPSSCRGRRPDNVGARTWPPWVWPANASGKCAARGESGGGGMWMSRIGNFSSDGGARPVSKAAGGGCTLRRGGRRHETMVLLPRPEASCRYRQGGWPAPAEETGIAGAGQGPCAVRYSWLPSPRRSPVVDAAGQKPRQALARTADMSPVSNTRLGRAARRAHALRRLISLVERPGGHRRGAGR